jgi:hypothetical protein
MKVEPMVAAARHRSSRRTRPSAGLPEAPGASLDCLARAVTPRCHTLLHDNPFTVPPPEPRPKHGPHQHDPGHPRALAVSLTLALGLNLVVLLLAAMLVARWHASPGAPQRAPWVVSVTLARSAADHQGPAAPRRASPPPGARTEAAIAPPAWHAASAPAEAASTPPAVAEAVDPPTPSTGTSIAFRFFASGEVDRPAEPDSDWNLDTAVLDAAGIERLVFDVFVSDTGGGVGCTILEPAEIAPATRTLLEDRLRQTVLQPALRGGMPVASVRRIEVTVLPPAP